MTSRRSVTMFAAFGIMLGACASSERADTTGSGGGAGSATAGSPGQGGAIGGAGTTGAAGRGGTAGTSAAGSGGTGGGSVAGAGGSDTAGVGGGLAGGGGAAATGGAGAGGVGGGGGAAGSGGGAGNAGAGGSAGRGGTGGGAGTGGRGGTSGGGASGTGGRGGTSGTAGRGGSGGATAGAGGTASGPFVCNQVTGGKLTEEWFIAGFENVVDNARWQVKWREDGYVEEWANPQSAFWTSPVDSSCASSTTSPDRVVFGAVTWKYTTQADFRTALTQAVNTFKSKYPNLRRIDMVTQIRGPNNMACPTAPTPGESIAVPSIQDAAMDEVAAAFPGFVFVGPKVQAHSCSEFQGGGPHLTAAGNTANVGVFANYFVQAQ